jgi:hypothetical protein
MFTDLRSNIYLKYSRLEVIAMLIAALGHDMHHPGYNNLFQINTKSDLAIKYNGKSVLEQYSADCLVELIENSNIIDYLNLCPSLDNETLNNKKKFSTSDSQSLLDKLNKNSESNSINNGSIMVNNDIIEKNSSFILNKGDESVSHRFENISKEPVIPKNLEYEFNLLDKEINEGLKTPEDINSIKREKIKKYFCDLVVEVILSTDMSTHFQLQDELAEISLTLNPNNDCLFTMENDLENNECYSNSCNVNSNTLTSLSSIKGTNIDLSSQMAVYEEEEFIQMEEPSVDKAQATINNTEFKENLNSNGDSLVINIIHHIIIY